MRRILARRRALTNPTSVASAASIGTASAPWVRRAASTDAAPVTALTSSATSRRKVSTKSEENAPIASMLASVSRSLSGWRLIPRATGQSGVAITEAISHNAVAPNANEPERHVQEQAPSHVGVEQEDDEREFSEHSESGWLAPT